MKTKKIIKQNKLCQEVVSITNNIVLIQLLIVSNSRLMVRYEKEKIVLQERIELMKNPNRANIEPKLKYSISLINNMDSYMRDAKVEMKCKLLGSMFPEKITFDGKSYRTNSYNSVLDLIYKQTNQLRGGKKEIGESFDTFPDLVPRAGLNKSKIGKTNKIENKLYSIDIQYLKIEFD